MMPKKTFRKIRKDKLQEAEVRKSFNEIVFEGGGGLNVMV